VSTPQLDPRLSRSHDNHLSQSDRRRAAELRLERERRLLLADWLAGSGTAAEFDAAWPEIQAQLGRFRVMELGDRARQRSLQRFHRPE
jgi:hypothetical protein